MLVTWDKTVGDGYTYSLIVQRPVGMPLGMKANMTKGALGLALILDLTPSMLYKFQLRIACRDNHLHNSTRVITTGRTLKPGG